MITYNKSPLILALDFCDDKSYLSEILLKDGFSRALNLSFQNLVWGVNVKSNLSFAINLFINLYKLFEYFKIL